MFAQSQLSNFYLIAEVLRGARWGLIIFFIVLVVVKNKYPGTKNGFFWLSFVTVAFIEMIFFDGVLAIIESKYLEKEKTEIIDSFLAGKLFSDGTTFAPNASLDIATNWYTKKYENE